MPYGFKKSRRMLLQIDKFIFVGSYCNRIYIYLLYKSTSFFFLQHDGLERNQSWYLEEIRIANRKTQRVTVFPCQQWLSLYDGDCQVKRILKPASSISQERVGVYLLKFFLLFLSNCNQRICLESYPLNLSLKEYRFLIIS